MDLHAHFTAIERVTKVQSSPNDAVQVPIVADNPDTGHALLYDQLSAQARIRNEAPLQSRFNLICQREHIGHTGGLAGGKRDTDIFGCAQKQCLMIICPHDLEVPIGSQSAIIERYPVCDDDPVAKSRRPLINQPSFPNRHTSVQIDARFSGQSNRR
tara:strand:+ start:734 stop:1204 length:471 start_codon:yes stop_codon:yes gene_type:complete